MNERLTNNRNGIAIRTANVIAGRIKPRKGEPDFFDGLQAGCTVPMDVCEKDCGYRERCRLRVIRVAIHNGLVEYGECCLSLAKKMQEGGEL